MFAIVCAVFDLYHSIRYEVATMTEITLNPTELKERLKSAIV
ncbi:hypothetical protein QUB60_26140 [Microcoleus sp. A2-C5]|nr:hypothetical protein [Lyngbya sp. CCAP 1446/10]